MISRVEVTVWLSGLLVLLLLELSAATAVGVTTAVAAIVAAGVVAQAVFSGMEMTYVCVHVFPRGVLSFRI